MVRRSFLCVFAAFVIGASYMVACGSEAAPTIDALPDGGAGDATFVDGDLPDGAGGMFLNDGGVCRGAGAACATGTECCSNACDPTAKKCVAGVGAGNCKVAAAACASSTECCNLTCVNGACGATACIADNQACSSGASCCGGTCTNGTCAPLNTTCKTSGNTCAQSGECCSKLCQGGRCQIASSYCVQSGDVCSDGTQCCGGVCTKAAGAAVGTCGAPPPSGGTNCGGGYDGVVCNGCTDCCSRLCAPFLSGVKICQPANGCHIEGDLCSKDTDCCGGDNTSGLPGNGNVKCTISAGYTIGICRSPTASGTDAGNGACNPEGNVCHYKNYVCGPSSSSKNDCCLHLGSKTDCELDAVGVPRCHAIGSPGGPACRTSGQTCAFTGDCCNNLPCVPGPGGQLVCYAGTSGADGGAVCVPTSGPCTVNADCCTGSFCTVAPGSIQGTCNPIPAGSGGGTGGTDGGGGGGTGGSTCSLFGQSCKAAGDCCSGVPCTGTDGVTPCFAGQAGCTCVYSTPR